jgi:hypothetical protein
MKNGKKNPQLLTLMAGVEDSLFLADPSFGGLIEIQCLC